MAYLAADKYLRTDATESTSGDVPPFVMPWLYMGGSWFIEEKSFDNLLVIEQALSKIKKRWKLAGMSTS